MDENNEAYWERMWNIPNIKKCQQTKKEPANLVVYYWMEWKRFDRKFNSKYQKQLFFYLVV